MYDALIVDDEPLMVDYLSSHLSEINEQWVAKATASDGIYAISLLQNEHFDAVITDIKMPGLDGLGLAKYLTENHPDISVIILTAYDDFSYARSAVRLNVFDYLLKPLRDEELSAALCGIAAAKERKDSGKPVHSEKIPTSGNPLIAQVKDYLQLHFREGLSLTMLSDIFSISPTYLSDLFHKEIGEPYSKYLLRLRMETAKALLLENNQTKVGDIANDLGFASAKHFTTVFRHYYGMTPSEWRAGYGS